MNREEYWDTDAFGKNMRAAVVWAWCKAAGVAFFFKKVGGKTKTIPEDLMVREYPERKDG